MKKTTKDIREESKKIFLEYVGENSNLRLLYFHTFLSDDINEMGTNESLLKDRLSLNQL